MTSTWAMIRFVDDYRAGLEAEATRTRLLDRRSSLRRRAGALIVRAGAAIGGIRPVDGNLPIGHLAR